jgi:hypothetical protein
VTVLWVVAYRAWFDHTRRLSPDVVFAVPWIQSETIPMKGIYLWNEMSLVAPASGRIDLPRGPGPMKVKRGEVVIRIRTEGRTYDLRAPDTGYFVAAADGREGQWRYSRLWPEADRVVEPPPLHVRRNGDSAARGGAVGKLIPQPQELRVIGFLPADPKLEDQFRRGILQVKMDSLDTPGGAEIRVHERYGANVKVYLTLSWFPPEAASSRRARLLVQTGEVSGVAVPDTAVTVRSGRTGVFQIQGNVSVFREVRGQPLAGGRFLVSSGLKLGDAVAVQGDEAEEGRIRLW